MGRVHPEGLFDSSIGGAAQVTWLVGDEVQTLDQVEERARVFLLADRLRRGLRPESPIPPAEPPPRVAINPSARMIVANRQATLTLSLGESDLEDIRLYQDGVPVALAGDLKLAAGLRRATVPVRLRRGVNRFYAMATRPGGRAADGRSNLVEIRCDGSQRTGRIHVLALGVSRYATPGRSLQFADRDARTLAAFLHEHGVNASGEPGLLHVLANKQVSEPAVGRAFGELRDAVADHPEDMVVVFRAGHTDVLAHRFYLLLGGYPFGRAPGASGPTRTPPWTTPPCIAT